MAHVVTSVDALTSRGNKISEMLGEISNLPSGPAWQPRSTRREYIIGVHSGAPAQSDYRSWRFPTFVSGIHAMYFERWMVIPDRKAFLDRAYLSLYRKGIDMVSEEELFALHCDPNEPDNVEHAVYKQGPHLHLLKSEIPGPHAHIALNRCNLDEVHRSVEGFTNAFHLAVIMIKDEVLSPLL